MQSVIQRVKECWFCGKTQGLESHHILYGTANRKLSEKYGFKVWLCHEHHTGGKDAVHMNKDRDLELKRTAQSYFEEHNGTREEFIKIFGRNYL